MADVVKISMQNVCFAYNERCVLQNFSLTLPAMADDTIIALAGASGCGKTTLLKLLAGLQAPQSGSIVCPPSQHTALLFQENRLLPGLTAAEQLRAVLPKGFAVEPYLAAVELDTEADALPGELSGGMQRRLALARCLAYAHNKRLLLLDEPFAGVDAKLTGRIMQRVRAMHRPVIYTAHNAEALALADSVIQLAGPPLRAV